MFVIIARVLVDVFIFKAIILKIAFGYTFNYARVFYVKLGKQ